jgi:acyl-coenzyme A thioesterase PaaI-like protein
MTPAPFDQASAVEPLGDGRYAARLDPAWNGPVGYSGGVIAAVLLRAAQAELGRADLPPRVLTIHYVAAAAPGPVQVTVTALRLGGRSAVLQAQLHQNERLTATAMLTCSVTRPQELTVELNAPAPTVPPVGEITELMAEGFVKAPPMLRRLRMWPCFGGPILGGAGQAVTGGWVALRDDPPDQPIHAPRLAALTDLWWPALFSATRELIGVPTLALTIHLRSSAPVIGPILARYETTTVAEGHLDEAAQLWSADGRLLAESHQLAQLIPRRAV